MVSPFKVIASIFSVIAVLVGLTFLVGEEGISLGFTTLKYPTAEKFLAYEQVAEANIDTILQDIDVIDETDTASGPVGPEIIRRDSAASGNLVGPNGIERVEDNSGLRRIDFPDDAPNLLHPFFGELEQIQTKRSKMRILHYGDSQIEGDRLTAYIRQRLQSTFGGTGPGFIPIKPVYNQITARIQPSDNWIRYAIFDPTLQTKIPESAYGAYMSVTRFTKEVADSLIDSSKVVTASVHIAKSDITYANAKAFTNVDIHYGRCKHLTLVRVKNNGELIIQDTLRTDGNYHVFPIRLPETPTDLLLEFDGYHSPDFYGMTLDGAFGLSMDNIAMRGSSGTVFTRIPYGLMNQMIDYLNTELIIMQFGGNALVGMKSEQMCTNFANWFKSQVKTLRSIRPEAQIIVIGPSDMSMKDGEDYVTYPLMEFMIDGLRKAAHESGAAYWDLYRAMGGRNSMPMWVEKGLAGPDYIHFTNAGAKYASELFVKALFLEYQRYADQKEGGSAQNNSSTPDAGD